MFGIDMADLVKLGEGALMALGGVAAALHIIAPLTKTKADDKAVGKLDKLASKLKWVLLPRKMK